ncbi:D-alanyl-D-alanine carboxypeptidase [[Actinomadura] parvosata subsp. kistnae]|uniref:D-alanyl-D-alanine carboxypeptidase family protein n=1 Tax=[Actinomadura] parvosata TaxID=1955412 RepID=UPI000D2DBE75|nr:D-alanyl-D-alanine carboxypeptidase [Actinomadura parvosata subsp. kistnae]
MVCHQQARSLLLLGNWTAPDALTRSSALSWPLRGQAAVQFTGQADGLKAHGKQRPMPIASVTEVMTALMILRDHPLRQSNQGPSIRVDRQAATESGNWDESTVPLRQGRRLTERQLLELRLIPSGNNVARLLTRWDAGSEEAFVRKMNATAAELGMRNATYTGTSGYEPTMVSTAVDPLSWPATPSGPPRHEEPRTAGHRRHRQNHRPGHPRCDPQQQHPARAARGGRSPDRQQHAGGRSATLGRLSRFRNRDRLILGVALRQGDPGDTLQEEKQAAFAAGRKLITAAQRYLHPRRTPAS